MIIKRAIFVCCAICTASVAASAAPQTGSDIEAIARPSKDPTLSFVRAGRIAEVLVKKGDVVQVGQVLVRQDDEAEQVQLAQLRAKAEDDTTIKARRADLNQKEVDLKKFEDAKKKGVATDLEVEHARLDVTIAELSLKLAQFQHDQDKKDYEMNEIQLKRMKLASPIAGKVEKILVQPGEAVDGLEDAVQVVTIDPLWIDVPVPLDKTKELKNGQLAEVQFMGLTGPALKGKIIHIAAVADAASDTLAVRVEVPNPSSRPAGRRVKVKFLHSGETTSLQKDKHNLFDVSQKPQEQGVVDGTAKQ